MEKLKEAFEQLHIPIDEEMIGRFEDYMEGILQWNEKMNLTAIKDREEFVTKHFVDSLLCNNFAEYVNAESVIDIGTGAGFPGVPLAIINRDKEFVLADSLNKRLKVIDELTAAIGLDNVTTIHGRAEELARNRVYREKFDVCVSRAVANMSVLAEYCLPFVRVGGYLLAYKGPDAEKETKDAEKALKVLGGKLKRIEPVKLAGFDHAIIVIEKVKGTPAKFPRKAGTPAKEPIT